MQKTNRRWSRIRQDERPTFAAVMLFVLVLPLMPAIAPACTSFGICQGTNIVVGNNDDWFSFSACLVVNKRDITDPRSNG